MVLEDDLRTKFEQQLAFDSVLLRELARVSCFLFFFCLVLDPINAQSLIFSFIFFLFSSLFSFFAFFFFFSSSIFCSSLFCSFLSHNLKR